MSEESPAIEISREAITKLVDVSMNESHLCITRSRDLYINDEFVANDPRAKNAVIHQDDEGNAVVESDPFLPRVRIPLTDLGKMDDVINVVEDGSASIPVKLIPHLLELAAELLASKKEQALTQEVIKRDFPPKIKVRKL